MACNATVYMLLILTDKAFNTARRTLPSVPSCCVARLSEAASRFQPAKQQYSAAAPPRRSAGLYPATQQCKHGRSSALDLGLSRRLHAATQEHKYGRRFEMLLGQSDVSKQPQNTLHNTHCVVFHAASRHFFLHTKWALCLSQSQTEPPTTITNV